MHLDIAVNELEKADPDSKISDTTQGYTCLSNSGLAESEQYTMMGYAGSSMKLTKLKPFLLDLLPKGSHHK
eukprot:1768044-Karenia_brevis.AAC.1